MPGESTGGFIVKWMLLGDGVGDLGNRQDIKFNFFGNEVSLTEDVRHICYSTTRWDYVSVFRSDRDFHSFDLEKAGCALGALYRSIC